LLGKLKAAGRLMKAQGDELLARVLSGDEWASGVSNDLLNEFFRGYPIENLVRLLGSDDERVVQSGAWIASELARDARPILKDLATLFDYPNVGVRYYCVETVLTAATDEDGEVVGSAISRITDSERPVRKMAFELMARADRSLLVAGAPYAKDSELAGLEWTLEVEAESRDDSEIASWLQDSDELKQLFAAVAAARVYSRSPHYLQLAASSNESDAQSFAASELAWLSKLEEQAQRRRERTERRNG
jgi:hypothetical protein